MGVAVVIWHRSFKLAAVCALLLGGAVLEASAQAHHGSRDITALADLPLPPAKCMKPPSEQRWVFWCNCIRGSFAATYAIARHMDEQGAAVVGFICVAGSEGGHQPSQAKTMAQLYQRFGPRQNQTPFVVRETKKPDGTWDHRGVDELLTKLKATHLYAHKSSGPDNLHMSKLPDVCNVMHYMFHARRPGAEEVSLRISDAVTGTAPVVMYMVEDPLEADLAQPDMREQLGIPADATVIGRYGGMNSFDIRCVQEAVCEVAKSSSNTYFLFANTEPFKSGCHKGVDRIIMLPSMESKAERVRFIKTTDAMVHARGGGESFGLAVGEWSVQNKPVFTTRTAGDRTAQMAHADILGNRAQLYTCSDVAAKLVGFDRAAAAARTDWNAYAGNSVAAIMARFMRLTSGYTGALVGPSAVTISLDALGDKVAATSCSGTGRLLDDNVHCVCPAGQQCSGAHCSHGHLVGSDASAQATRSGYSIEKCTDCYCA